MSYKIKLNNTKDSKAIVFAAATNGIDGVIKDDEKEARLASMLSVLSLVSSKPIKTFTLEINKGNEKDFISELKENKIMISTM